MYVRGRNSQAFWRYRQRARNQSVNGHANGAARHV